MADKSAIEAQVVSLKEESYKKAKQEYLDKI